MIGCFLLLLQLYDVYILVIGREYGLKRVLPLWRDQRSFSVIAGLEF